jgi:cob(I)alamin adenosyltransferase
MVSDMRLPVSEDEHQKRMKAHKAAHERKQARSTREKGLLVVNTGLGKGKTTAALGIALRALGHGMKVGIVQFIKGAVSTGEQAFAGLHSGQLDLLTLGEGYTWDTQNRARDIDMARRAWDTGRALMADPTYDIVIFDELNVVLKYAYLPLDEVLETFRRKREALHVVVTGRYAPPGLIELADLVTEMKLVKHPYAGGIVAQRGIEF